jgi:general secretion pathway protein J
MNRRNGGFTLLEVLVAMSIFAFIGLGANQMLRTIIDTREITSASNKLMNSIVRALSVMERDFSQIVPRSVRDEYGEPLEPMQVGSGDYLVELTRTGWNNPAKRTRSNLQRVAYEIKNGVLVRHFWLVLDRAEDSEPISQELLEGIEDLRISLLDEAGEGTDTWPESENQKGLPLAVEVILQPKGFGELRRVFILASMADPVSRADNENENENSGNGDQPEDSAPRADPPDASQPILTN